MKCRCRAQVHGKEDLQKLLDLEPHGSCQRNTAHHCWAGNGCSLPWPLEKGERVCVIRKGNILLDVCFLLRMLLFPNIFVWGSCFGSVSRRPPPPPPPPRASSYSTLSHTIFHTHLSDIHLSHTTSSHTHNKLCVRDVCFTHTHTCL